jgi:lipoprotein-anchoring transpeptidase ErfK/SrfK
MLLQHRQIAFAAIVTFLTAVPGSAREIVNYNAAVGPGTIVIRTRERRLYLVVGQG